MDPTNTTLYGSDDYGNSTVLEIQYRYEGSDVLSIINADEQCPSFCQPIFDKFELFKREITTLSNCDNTKQILNRSISLWNELLQMVKNATNKDLYYLDESLNLVTKLFLDAKETKLFNDDTNFSRNLFFNYLNLINTHEFQQFLILPSSSTLIDIIFESNMDTALLLMIHLSNFVLFVDSDLADQYNSLLNAIRIHIDQKIQSTILGKQIEKNRSTLHERTLLFLWHLSDHTVVIPSLLRAGYGKCVIEWLNCPTLPDDIRRPIVSIVHNIARHDEGADELNRYRAIDTINQMQQLDTVHKSEMLLLNTMALALLSTPNQIKEDPTGTKCILDQLLQITVNASIAERFRYNGFHVSEPLAVLVKLFVDDATFDYVMNQGQTNVLPNSTTTMKLFSDLLVTFYGMLQKKIRLEQFTFIALINILWSVSFHEIYHEELKEHEGLISIIRNIAISDSQLIIEQYVPRSMQSVKKAADGILFNLRLETSVVPTSFPLLTIAQQKPLVMISYSHANSDFCNKILELLDQKADQFDVWIDQRCCKTSGDVWESIAKGIKSADLIICVISEEYMASKACRQEVIYAKDRLNKRFLPVFVGRPEMSEWLGKINYYYFLLLFLVCCRYSTCSVQIYSFRKYEFKIRSK